MTADRKAIRRSLLDLMNCGYQIEYSETIRMTPSPKTGQPEDRTDNKQMHRKTRPDGTVREYVISPCQMAAREGKHYLICNYDKYNDISNYRVDRIADIKILDEPAKPFGTLDWANGRTLDLEEYMKEHPLCPKKCLSSIRQGYPALDDGRFGAPASHPG